MIDINGKIKIPNKWEELTIQQATDTVGLLMGLMSGAIPLKTFRILLLQALTGYRRSRKRLSPEMQEQLEFNLVFLAEQLTYAIKPKYRDPDVLTVLSPELQERLKMHFPYEVYEPVFVQELTAVGSRLQYDPVPNLNMKQNPLPVIHVGGKTFRGPVFTIDPNDVVQTDIVAGEFLLAGDYAEIYHKTGDMRYLDSLMSVYYRQGNGPFSQVDCERQIFMFKQIDARQKFLAYLFHCSITEYLNNHPVYGIIFKSGGSQEPGSNFSGILYQMAKDNYGSIQEVSQILLSDFIGLMYKQLLDAVHTLHELKKTPGEIASQLKLSDDQIIDILKDAN
jgi:hypothetical protein